MTVNIVRGVMVLSMQNLSLISNMNFCHSKETQLFRNVDLKTSSVLFLTNKALDLCCLQGRTRRGDGNCSPVGKC